MFVEISQNSQGNTCTRVSVLIKLQVQHHQVPSTLISGTGTHTVVLFVAELQHVVVLDVEVEPFRQIAYLVVQWEYQIELPSAFSPSVHAKTLLYGNWCRKKPVLNNF